MVEFKMNKQIDALKQALEALGAALQDCAIERKHGIGGEA
jgi:recombination DNA repair RAD52 pathway protein